MAKNKKEQAAFDAAVELAGMAKAMRFTDEVKPDIIPTGTDKVWGWTFNSYTGAVSKVWSNCNSNGGGNCIASQGSISLYSSEVLALQALRDSLELKCANDLLRTDKRIKDAKQRT